MTKAGIKIIVFAGLVGLVSILMFTISAEADEQKTAEIKDKKILITDFSELDLNTEGASPLSSAAHDQLELAPRGGGFEQERIYTSEEINTDFIFNAIGVHWKYDAPEATDISIEIRVNDGDVWNDWQKLGSDSFVIRDDSSVDEEVENKETYSDLVFVESGQKFQYRITLNSGNPEITPKLDEIEFHYIDSTEGPAAPEFEQGWFKKANAASAAGGPTIISRTQWGCPQGETSPEWAPETATKSYHVIHHTVTTNGAEPYSTVRAIWQYHYNRTWSGGIWGDIGYNYLVDQYGRIFKGRNGPENVIGAHVYGYNTPSIGVAVLGDYRYVSPSSASLSGVSTIIGYTGAATGMSSIRLYGHRDLDSTACPGDKLYAKKSSILSSAKQKLTQYSENLVRYQNERYYVEGNQLWRIPTDDIFGNWGFLAGMVQDIDQAEFDSYDTPKDLDYFARNSSQAYIAVGGKLRRIDSGYLLSRWGKDFNDVPFVPDLTSKRVKISSVSFMAKSPSTGMVYYLPGSNYKHWVAKSVYRERGYSLSYDSVPHVSSLLLARYTTRGDLSYSDGTYHKPVVKYVGDGTYGAGYYYHETSYLRFIPTTDILLNYGFSKLTDVRDIAKEEFDTYLVARDLDYFSRNETQVYMIKGGKLRRVSESYLNSRWGMTFVEVEKNRGLVNNMVKIADVMYLARSYSRETNYYLPGGDQKEVVFDSVIKNRGYYSGVPERVPIVPTPLLDRYADSGYMFYKDGTLIRKVGSTGVYYMENEEKRYMSRDVFISWGFNSTKILDITSSMFDLIPDGSGFPPKKVTTLLGPYGSPVYLPANSGKTAREQHLWLISNETASHHYSVSGTPLSCQNGMAGGFGAFGSAASISQERYYMNMRWNYCTWYEDNGITKVKNCDSVLKTWHRHKKVIVTNPANGKSVVVSIEEAGPQIWTGRVSGLSPEAMRAIGAETNDSLTYYWVGSQAVPLGPIN